MDKVEIEIIKGRIRKYPKCRMLQIGNGEGVVSHHCMPLIKKMKGVFDTVDIDVSPGHGTWGNPKERNDFFALALEDGIYDKVVRFYREGSDKFFKRTKRKYDVIFIDGDHEYAQSKRDLTNSIRRLREGGVIFVHDIKKTVQGLGPEENVRRTYNEFSLAGWRKQVLDTTHCMAKIWRES